MEEVANDYNGNLYVFAGSKNSIYKWKWRDFA
jgi:hypothetical protein